MLLSRVAPNHRLPFYSFPDRWKVVSAEDCLWFMQLAGRQHNAAGREVKDSVGKEGDTLISVDFGLEQHNYEHLSLESSLPLSFPPSFLTTRLSSLGRVWAVLCQVDLLNKWSSSSRGPWPLFLFTSERWVKLASPAPDPDPDPDPDTEPNQRRTNEEQYVSEGESSQLDAHPAPPECRDAETITGMYVRILANFLGFTIRKHSLDFSSY